MSTLGSENSAWKEKGSNGKTKEADGPTFLCLDVRLEPTFCEGRHHRQGRISLLALPTLAQKKTRQRLGTKPGFRKFIYLLSVHLLKMRFPVTLSPLVAGGAYGVFAALNKGTQGKSQGMQKGFHLQSLCKVYAVDGLIRRRARGRGQASQSETTGGANT